MSIETATTGLFSDASTLSNIFTFDLNCLDVSHDLGGSCGDITDVFDPLYHSVFRRCYTRSVIMIAARVSPNLESFMSNLRPFWCASSICFGCRDHCTPL